MGTPIRINKECCLLSSSNTYLPYPVDGILETAEIGSDGQILWATFRAKQNGWLGGSGYGCPAVVRHIRTTVPVEITGEAA